jgi:energy-converting hydrogenase B subunit D
MSDQATLVLQLMQLGILLFVAVMGAGVVLTRDPVSQSIAVSLYGLLVASMFFLFQAPDVALSQLTVGAVALPLMLLLAMARIRRNADEQKGDKNGKEPAEP